MHTYLKLSYLGSISALGVAACCILPITLMMIGLGGSWIAVLGTIAALSTPVVALSALFIAVSWVVAYRRGSLWRLRWWLSGSTALSVIAGLVVAYQVQINDFLILRM